MIFINSSGEYPRHIGDLQLEHSSWQPGDDIPEDWKQVFETEPPTDIGTEEVFYEAHPVEIDGVWYQNWQVRQITEEERDAIEAVQLGCMRSINQILSNYI